MLRTHRFRCPTTHCPQRAFAEQINRLNSDYADAPLHLGSKHERNILRFW